MTLRKSETKVPMSQKANNMHFKEWENKKALKSKAVCTAEPIQIIL